MSVTYGCFDAQKAYNPKKYSSFNPNEFFKDKNFYSKHFEEKKIDPFFLTQFNDGDPIVKVNDCKHILSASGYTKEQKCPLHEEIDIIQVFAKTCEEQKNLIKAENERDKAKREREDKNATIKLAVGTVFVVAWIYFQPIDVVSNLLKR